MLAFGNLADDLLRHLIVTASGGGSGGDADGGGGGGGDGGSGDGGGGSGSVSACGAEAVALCDRLAGLRDAACAPNPTERPTFQVLERSLRALLLLQDDAVTCARNNNAS